MSFSLICDNGEVVTATEELLNQITYFKGLLNMPCKETTERIITLEGISADAVKNIISFVQTKLIMLPQSQSSVEEYLGAAQYFSFDHYIVCFMNKYIIERNDYVEMIELLYLTDQMKEHLTDVARIVPSLTQASRLHLISTEAMLQMIELIAKFASTARRYLFSILREWYLFDRKSEKVPVIIEMIPHLKFSKESMMPLHRSTLFVEVFPDLRLAKHIALVALREFK